MAVQLTPRAIVRYGCILLAVVIVYNVGGYIHGRKSPSKAEEEVAKMLSRQQEMAGDMKDLRALVKHLRSDLQSAGSAQEEVAKAVQQAAKQEAEERVAAVAADLRKDRAVAAKLSRAAEAQQQQIEALQAKLHVAVSADSQHEAALTALQKEHAEHLANSLRADRSVRQEDAAPAEAAAAGGRGGAAEQRAGGGGGGGGSGKQSNRKQGAALLPKRGGKGRRSGLDGDAAEANSDGRTNEYADSGGSLAQRAGLRAGAAAGDGGSNGSGSGGNGSADVGSQLVQGSAGAFGDGSTRQGSSSAKLDQHARQQAMAGRDPRKVVAMHTGSDAAASPAAGPSTGAARLLDAHAAVLAAKKAEHAQRLQQGASGQDAADGFASGSGIAGHTSGIAGAASGRMANRPTVAPGLEELLEDPGAVGGLNGAALADAHAAVRNQAELSARGRRGNGGGEGVIDAGAAGILRGQKVAIAPLTAAAAEAQDTARGAEVGARELVKALAKGDGGDTDPRAAGAADSVLEDLTAVRAAMLDAAKSVHASHASDGVSGRMGGQSKADAIGGGTRLSSLHGSAAEDAAVADRAAMVAAGKAAHATRTSGADMESNESGRGGSGSKGSGSLHNVKSSLQQAETFRFLGDGDGGGLDSVTGLSGRGRDAGGQSSSRGGSSGNDRGSSNGAAGARSSITSESSSEGDPLEQYSAALDRKAVRDQGLVRQGSDAVAR